MKKTRYKRIKRSVPNPRRKINLLSFVFLFILLTATVFAVANLKTVHVLFSNAQAITYTPGTVPGCQFQKADGPVNVAFCDTFDQPMGTGNRSGDLNGLVWGVSRVSSGTNPSQGQLNDWASLQMQGCGNPTVIPDNDVKICNGQLLEAVNDNGGQTILAMYPKQPFDIAGRTGTVTFDVSATSQGPHAAWPSFIYTDLPVPAPYSAASAIFTNARNSFGFTLSPAGNANCQNVYDMFITRNYALENHTGDIGMRNNCIKTSSQPGQMNHIEVRMSQNQIQIWGTDAGKTSPMIEIGQFDNANLPLTRGLIWMEDVHYNADKFNHQRLNTFGWDNVGFDGPTLARDLAYDVADSLVNQGGGSEQLGYSVDNQGNIQDGGWPNQKSMTLQVQNVDKSLAVAAVLTFNADPTSTKGIQYRVNNGAWEDTGWPFTSGENANVTYGWRTYGVPVPLSDIQTGTNTIFFKLDANETWAIANINLIMVGGGGVPNGGGSSPTPTTSLPTTLPTIPLTTLTNSPIPSTIPSSTPTNLPTPISSPTLGTTTSGLLGSYFSNQTLSGTSTFIRIDPNVNFNWRRGSPDPRIPKDHFSVRWTGFITPPQTAIYTFLTQSDDGIRLWVNNSEIINNWTDHPATTNHGTISLVAGQKYPVTLEYYENEGNAVSRLFWNTPRMTRQVIPGNAFSTF